MKKTPTIDEIVAIAKRRGFVYPNSEIYGGFVGLYDYGPYGALLAQNIRSAWWRSMVQLEDNIVGLDSSIFTRPEVWVASGHVGGFSDPVVECRECNTRSRADHLIDAPWEQNKNTERNDVYSICECFQYAPHSSPGNPGFLCFPYQGAGNIQQCGTDICNRRCYKRAKDKSVQVLQSFKIRVNDDRGINAV